MKFWVIVMALSLFSVAKTSELAKMNSDVKNLFTQFQKNKISRGISSAPDPKVAACTQAGILFGKAKSKLVDKAKLNDYEISETNTIMKENKERLISFCDMHPQDVFLK